MQVKLIQSLLLLIQACINIPIAAPQIVEANNDVPITQPEETCNPEGSTFSQESLKNCNGDIENGATEPNVSSTWAFMDAFSKLGSSWNQVVGEYISVVRNADGKELVGDIYAEGSIEEGLELMRSMVKSEASKSKEDKLAWSFHVTPLKEFKKTIDDVLLAFLRWSLVDTHVSNGNSKDDIVCKLIGGTNRYPTNPQKINVSKAFRRLTSYIQWMESVAADIGDSPLTYASISNCLSIFSIHVTHDSCGRLIWWVNLGKTRIQELKLKSPKETIRMFVWVAHLLFFDMDAQTKGLVVIDDMSEVGFWEYMTMLPLKVGISVDRFLISVTPLKAKNVVLMRRPRWAETAYRLLSWFLTNTMKSRVTIVERGKEETTLHDIVGGSAFIPADFADVKGEIRKDLISLYY